MRKIALLAVFIIVASSSVVYANSIFFPDFTGATLTATTLDPANSSSLKKWIGVGNPPNSGWSIYWDSGDYYARNWGEGDYVLMQGFSGSDYASGSQVSFSMAYVYTEGFMNSTIGVVSILGGDAGDIPINVYGSPTSNWEFATWDVLYSKQLGYASGWSSISGTFNLSNSYDVIAIVVRAGIYPGTSGLRAVDDVVIEKVPESSALLLLGTGLFNLIAYRRRKRME